MPTTASSSSSSVAAWPSSTATTTAARPVPGRWREPRPRLFRNQSPAGRRARLRGRCRRRRRTSIGVTGAYPTRHRWRRRSPTWRFFGRGENVMLRGLGDCRFDAANETLGVRWRLTAGRRLQRDAGRRSATLPDARLRQLPRRATIPTAPRLRGQPALPAEPRPARPTGRPSPSARHVRAVDAVQRLGPLGTARPARQQRPPLLRRRQGEEQLWRIAPGEPPTAYTPLPMAGQRLRICRAWASPATT